MKAGDKVRFVEALDEGDEDAVMTVVEMRGDRVLVTDDSLIEWTIQPTQSYFTEELEVIA